MQHTEAARVSNAACPGHYAEQYIVQLDMVHATKGNDCAISYSRRCKLACTFQIKLLHQTQDDVDIQSSDCMKTAVSSFLSLHQVTGDVANAPAFFGISCPAVQHVLYERFHPSRPGRTYERVNLKPPVKMLELETRSKDDPTPASDIAPVLRCSSRDGGGSS
jgi:hypothetical protein